MQRRTISDPVMYTLAAIQSQRVYEEVEVWPNTVHKDAIGHGPLDYYLIGPSSEIVINSIGPKRNDQEAEDEYKSKICISRVKKHDEID